MARAIWSGSINFGLVNVPVKAFGAVREHAVHFHQVEKATGARIRYEKVSERSGQEVPSEDIQLGYELAKGKLVTVDPDQLIALRPRTTRTIDVTDFVHLSEVDPVFYDRSYWLAPDGEAAGRPYWLLVQAMQDRGQAGIGTIVMRNKQYLAAIRPRDEALALSTMRFADEVVPKSDAGLPMTKSSAPAAKDLHLAVQIVDALTTKWDPSRYRDTYTDQVKELIEAQAAGKHVVDEAPARDGKVLDLRAALEASLRAAKKAGSSAASRLQQLEMTAREITDKDAPVPERAKTGRQPRSKRPRRKDAGPRSPKPTGRKSA
jgi:DNA end-binding protein Ku